MAEIKKPELISPVQDFASLNAAINAGADAVYFGLKEFSMRANAKNFDLNEIKKVIDICHKNKIKAYLTLNTIIYENELEKIKRILKKIKEYGIDAVHAWDFAVINEARKLRIPVHLSTQASVSNSEAAELYKKIGIKRIILARECTLKQIKEIKKKLKNIEIEVFVHGAMCVSISGRCFLSQFLFGKSANRGECIQPCRREYVIEDFEQGKRLGNKLRIGNNYILSPKDLCALLFIDKLIEAGIDAFKIEGRNRSPEYVKVTTECYREAIDLHTQKKLTEDKKKKIVDKLKEVYNRGFSEGFYFGMPAARDFTDSHGTKAEALKEYVGKIINFYNKIKVADILIESGSLKEGDEIYIEGNKTGITRERVKSIEISHKEAKEAKKGQRIGIKISKSARKNDKIYLIKVVSPNRNI